MKAWSVIAVSVALLSAPRAIAAAPISSVNPTPVVSEAIAPAAAPHAPLWTSNVRVGVIDIIASPILLLVSAIVVFIVIILIVLWGYTRVYTIAPTNEAFVKTGGVFAKNKQVILNGGCIVLPGFHELTRVPLREISIDVERTGKLAVRTQDYLRADMRVTFYVCINASEEDVLTAGARLSSQGRIVPENIKEALEKRADDGIRAAAKNKSLAEIDSDKLGFAQEVLNIVEPDLKKVGLTLNNIAISEVEESDTYDTNNFFDAQGVRLRTETIQRSIQQKREVELETQVAIQQKELEARKLSLQLEQEKESAQLDQRLQVEAAIAQKEREIQEAQERESASAQRTKILQEKSVEEEEIRRKLSIQQSQIEADIELEEQQKKLKVAQALQQQESDIAEIERKKAIQASQLLAQAEVAEAEQQTRTVQADMAIAIAAKQKESFEAEAERTQAEEAVKTAKQIEIAQRDQQLVAIAAQQDAEKERISANNVVEVDVFRRRRQAEVARQAAELEAESIRTLADANRDRSLAEAEGVAARSRARNALNNANITADLINQVWPELSKQLPEVLQALAPQPGVIGDARIYSFPGAQSNGDGSDINKILLSTSGLKIIDSLLEEGKLGGLIDRVGELLRDRETPASDPTPLQAPTFEAAPPEPLAYPDMGDDDIEPTA